MRHTPHDAQERYRRVFHELYPPVLAFVRRRYPEDAEAVAAEAFLTLWRRFDAAPTDPAALRAWMFQVARHGILNELRAGRRRTALAVRVSEEPADTPPEDDRAAQRLDLARAWNALAPEAQEALSLSLFDALTSAQAATVLGITATAYRARLSRARRALATLHDTDPQEATR